jgi:hypothetical protein
MRLKKHDLVLCPSLGSEEFEIVSDTSNATEYRVMSMKTKVTHKVTKDKVNVPDYLVDKNRDLRASRSRERLASRS